MREQETAAHLAALMQAGLHIADIPEDAKPHYTVRVGSDVLEGRGFRSMLKADEWIGLHRKDLDWRAGYVFRLKGLRADIAILNRENLVLK